MNKMHKKNIRVETSAYEASHGRKPKGYGGWWFEIAGEWASFTGTFTQAKGKAISLAQDRGAYVVKVRP